LQNTFKELKRFKPHMIILALTRSQKVTLLTEAYKANLTTTHGWMWLALNSVSNLPLEKIIFKGQSYQFKGRRCSRFNESKTFTQMDKCHQSNHA